MNTLFLSFLNSLKNLILPQNPTIFHYFLYICASIILIFFGLLTKLLPGFFKDIQEKEYKKEQEKLQLQLKIKIMEEDGKERRSQNYIKAQKDLTLAVNKICENTRENGKELYKIRDKTNKIERRNEDIWEEVRK